MVEVIWSGVKMERIATKRHKRHKRRGIFGGERGPVDDYGDEKGGRLVHFSHS